MGFGDAIELNFETDERKTGFVHGGIRPAGGGVFQMDEGRKRGPQGFAEFRLEVHGVGGAQTVFIVNVEDEVDVEPDVNAATGGIEQAPTGWGGVESLGLPGVQEGGLPALLAVSFRRQGPLDGGRSLFCGEVVPQEGESVLVGLFGGPEPVLKEMGVAPGREVAGGAIAEFAFQFAGAGIGGIERTSFSDGQEAAVPVATAHGGFRLPEAVGYFVQGAFDGLETYFDLGIVGGDVAGAAEGAGGVVESPLARVFRADLEEGFGLGGFSARPGEAGPCGEKSWNAMYGAREFFGGGLPVFFRGQGGAAVHGVFDERRGRGVRGEGGGRGADRGGFWIVAEGFVEFSPGVVKALVIGCDQGAVIMQGRGFASSRGEQFEGGGKARRDFEAARELGHGLIPLVAVRRSTCGGHGGVAAGSMEFLHEVRVACTPGGKF